jgi:hypothetical protein
MTKAGPTLPRAGTDIMTRELKRSKNLNEPRADVKPIRARPGVRILCR